MILAVQLGSPLAAAVPTTEQLAEIAGFLSENNVEALRAFLLLHPELLDGATPLADLLREFMAQSENVTDFLGFEPDLRESIGAPTPDDPALVPDAPDIPDEVLY